MTDTASRICFVIGYYLIDSTNGIQHTVYGIIRNIIGNALTPKKRAYKLLGFSLMAAILCIMYGLSFNGISTIMFILSGLINLFAVIFADAQGIRVGTILAALCNIIAFLIIRSYASSLGEAVCIIIGFLSLIKGNGDLEF